MIDTNDIKRVDMATKEVTAIHEGSFAYSYSMNVFKSPSYPNEILSYGTSNGLFLWDIIENK